MGAILKRLDEVEAKNASLQRKVTEIETKDPVATAPPSFADIMKSQEDEIKTLITGQVLHQKGKEAKKM